MVGNRKEVLTIGRQFWWFQGGVGTIVFFYLSIVFLSYCFVSASISIYARRGVT